MARILIVDDERAVRVTMRRILERDGHEVCEAGDGEAALEQFRALLPDLVLMDLYMPKVDGVEATIRLQTEFPGAQVIGMSGGGWRSKEAVLEEVAGLGIADTLPKPFTMDEVLDVVSRVLAAA
ncbi:MAG: response regulator [Gemmatimonadetes bacterium]|nr:response regulator [Gemmatimonadota bacterium]